MKRLRKFLIVVMAIAASGCVHRKPLKPIGPIMRFDGKRLQ